MKTLLREPLVYFLLLGGLFFGAYNLVSDKSYGEQERNEIVITDGQIDALIRGFERVRQRLPSQQELDGLLQAFIREEIMYREALAMGLDRGDAIIRRQLQKKLEFLSEDIATLEEPTDTELQNFLTDKPHLFREPTRFTLEHIYFNSSTRGESVRSDAQSLLDTLKEQENQSGSGHIPNSSGQYGDLLVMTQSRFEKADESEISAIFGGRFLEAIKEIPIGHWEGPIESGLGVHIVYLRERLEGDVPPFNELRSTLKREWEAVKRQQANDAFYSALRERYTVTLAEPVPANLSPPQQQSVP
tara:strand:+ start:810 stop:1715 length:906 start_codon:yes stop_codon:yes gene_type:complete